MSDPLHIVCPHCGSINRIPQEKLGAGGKCGKCANPLFVGQPMTLTRDNFERYLNKHDIPVLVDFWAPWCGPCRMVGPIIEELSQEYDGKAVVGKVDVDKNQQFAAKFGIRNIPTVLVFKDGEIVNRQVGVSPKKVYADAIEAAL